MRVVFSDRAYAGILAETAEKIETETGGLFLGHYSDGVFYVVEAIDPGPKSVFEVAYFEYDCDYTQHLINKIANLYNEKLDLVGLWHRHPGSFDQFSGTDDGTNAKYAAMREAGAISALVNVDPDFRLTMYHVMPPHHYQRIPFEVGDSLLLEQLLKLKPTSAYLEMMKPPTRRREDAAERYRAYTRRLSLLSFFDFIHPQLTHEQIRPLGIDMLAHDEESRSKVIEHIIDDIGFLSDELNLEITVYQDEVWLYVVQETIDGVFEVRFSYVDAEDRIVMSLGEEDYDYEAGMLKAYGERELHNRQADARRAAAPVREVEQQSVDTIGAVLRVILGKKEHR